MDKKKILGLLAALGAVAVKTAKATVVEGMKQRFRSVQMTALSFVIGVLPLLFATGAGANSRHAVGVATFWGMLTATLVGMLFVPPLYVLFRRLAGAKG